MMHGPAPAGADPPTRLLLVGMGDSYTTGAGIPPAEASSAHCRRSQRAYPSVAAEALGMSGRNVACGGAVVADLTAPPRPGVPAQIAGLAGADVAAMTIGGNDVGGPRGVLDSGSSDRAMAQFGTDVQALVPRLQEGLAAVQAAAPRARLFVLGYPDIMPRRQRAFAQCLGALAAGLDVSAVHSSVYRLNEAVRRAAASVGAIFVDTSASFVGHEMCAPTPYANAPGRRSAHPGGGLHPNELGQLAMAADLAAAITGSAGGPPEGPNPPADPPVSPVPPVAPTPPSAPGSPAVPPRVGPPIPIPPPPTPWTAVQRSAAERLRQGLERAVEGAVQMPGWPAITRRL